jgi:hypothetical protein
MPRPRLPRLGRPARAISLLLYLSRSSGEYYTGRAASTVSVIVDDIEAAETCVCVRLTDTRV